MAKPKVLVITAGGTFCYKRNGKLWLPSTDPYLQKVEGLEDLAEIEHVDLGAVDSMYVGSGGDDFNDFVPYEEKVTRLDIARKIFDRRYTGRQLQNGSSFGGKLLDLEGVVVLQGSDTSTETGSALNYYFQDLGIPIVVAATQTSIWKEDSEAAQIIRSAVKIATMDIGETVLTDGGYITRANRGIKFRTDEYPIFVSFTSPPLGEINRKTEEITLYNNHINRRETTSPTFFEDFDTRLGSHKPVSGGTFVDWLDFSLTSRNVVGMLVEGWGRGTIDPNLLHSPWIDRGECRKPIAVVTKCLGGGLELGEYAQGVDLEELGFIDCADLTWDAATHKMYYAMGRVGKEGIPLHSREFMRRVSELMRTPINRDMTLDLDQRYDPLKTFSAYNLRDGGYC